MTYYSEVYYPRNREQMIARSKSRIAANRVLIDRHKRAPCDDCGQRFHTEAMEFDHVRGVKKRNISAMVSYSPAKLLQEIAKCDLVCANCHRVRTFNRRAG